MDVNIEVGNTWSHISASHRTGESTSNSVQFSECREKSRSTIVCSLALSLSWLSHIGLWKARLPTKGSGTLVLTIVSCLSPPHEWIPWNPSMQIVTIIIIILIITLDLTDYLEDHTCKGKDLELAWLWWRGWRVTPRADVCSPPSALG